MANKQSKSTYHHGDLRSTLIDTAHSMLKEGGIEALSLRKLADKVGVSRTAPYHHFKDKNALLCAIAEQGFEQWQAADTQILEQDYLSDADKLRASIRGYIIEATNNPELYDLMFGRIIWKQNTATKDLRDVAYQSFQYRLKVIRHWQEHGLLPKNEDTLRLTQVTWGTIHGLSRLLIDGIYADPSNIDEICDCVVNLFKVN